MNGRELGAARDLGPQAINVRKFTVYPAAAVDVQHGSPIPGDFDSHLRILLITEGEGLLIPCNRQFLRKLSTQCLAVSDPER